MGEKITMLETSKSKEQQPAPSLRKTLAVTFISFSILALLLVSIFQIGLNFQAQQQIVADLISLRAAAEVSAFVEKFFNTLEATAQVGSVPSVSPGDRRLLLDNLLRLEPAFSELALLDERGQELVRVTPTILIAPSNLINYADSDLFAQVQQGQRYIGSVYFDETTGEPRLKIAIPVKNIYDEFEGVLVAEINLIFLSEMISSLQIGQAGLAYVVDNKGNLVAFRDVSQVLHGNDVSKLPEVAEFLESQGAADETVAEFDTGIMGTNVLETYIPLGVPDWAVVIELPIGEAYQGIIGSLMASVGALILVAIMAGIAGIYVARYLAAPLLNLTETVTRIAGGETELIAAVEGSAEVAHLAEAFNTMTAQLREAIGSLEQRVIARTQRLEIAATLGEQLSGILNLDELLAELVHQIKDKFGYYHTHVYLFDESRQTLLLAAGAGQAGAEMKAKGHHIGLETDSLVARAARTSEIVYSDDVEEAPDWLPNPLLPDTRSEMAVPISLEGQVLGVLDVQQDTVAGLDEGDANLLRSLANQVAVAVRNARLFAEVESALAEARAVQQQYAEQAWQRSKTVQQTSQYLYARPNAAPLDQAKQKVLAETQQQATALSHPAIIAVNGDESRSRALIAPVNLRDKTIGTLQLHAPGDNQIWNEDDLAVIQAVVDQLAQTAENLRLFDETRERAAREQTVREIAEKMQIATDLQELIKTTAEELGKYFSLDYAVVELGVKDKETA
jgi:GAF domain-containing protein/HAMP domain-containing protein